MSFDVKSSTITIGPVTYDVVEEQEDHGMCNVFTIEHKGTPIFDGLTGTVGCEEYIESYMNPRSSDYGDCNLGAMAIEYRGYDLGDEHASLPDDGCFEIECERCDGTGQSEDRFELIRGGRVVAAGTEEAVTAFATMYDDGFGAYPFYMGVHRADCETCKAEGNITVDPATYFRHEHGATVVIPLFVYEHSGITISGGSPVVTGPITRDHTRSTGRYAMDGAGWDTSFVGFIYDDRAQMAKMGCEDFTVEQIVAALNAEIEIYASYLENDVTYYRVEDPETGFDEGCGGYVGGYGEYAKEECFSSLEDAIERRIAENIERDYWAACDVETVA